VCCQSCRLLPTVGDNNNVSIAVWRVGQWPTFMLLYYSSAQSF
jgi:hypothetical protein